MPQAACPTNISTSPRIEFPQQPAHYLRPPPLQPEAEASNPLCTHTWPAASFLPGAGRAQAPAAVTPRAKAMLPQASLRSGTALRSSRERTSPPKHLTAAGSSTPPAPRSLPAWHQSAHLSGGRSPPPPRPVPGTSSPPRPAPSLARPVNTAYTAGGEHQRHASLASRPAPSGGTLGSRAAPLFSQVTHSTTGKSSLGDQAILSLTLK